MLRDDDDDDDDDEEHEDIDDGDKRLSVSVHNVRSLTVAASWPAWFAGSFSPVYRSPGRSRLSRRRATASTGTILIKRAARLDTES